MFNSLTVESFNGIIASDTRLGAIDVKLVISDDLLPDHCRQCP